MFQHAFFICFHYSEHQTLEIRQKHYDIGGVDGCHFETAGRVWLRVCNHVLCIRPDGLHDICEQLAGVQFIRGVYGAE